MFIPKIFGLKTTLITITTNVFLVPREGGGRQKQRVPDNTVDTPRVGEKADPRTHMLYDSEDSKYRSTAKVGFQKASLLNKE